jgi:dephospho-CoA kinase
LERKLYFFPWVGTSEVRIIGITGGIGSGKSTVARFLARLGATVIDADKVGHAVFQPNTEAWQEVVGIFGQEVLSADGTIDRKRLASVVFEHPESLARLNRIMHPRIREQIATRLREYRRQGVAMVVLEAPLLLEAGLGSQVDEVWVTSAPEDVVLKRLREQVGLSAAEARARIRAQPPGEERIMQADVVIDTDCSLDELEAKVKELWQGLTTRI